jgi:outer membrane lipoprotein-sorting protein
MRVVQVGRSVFLVVLALLCLAMDVTVRGEEIDAKEIINQVDRLMRGDSSFGVAEMSISTKRWKRSKTLEIWSEGTDKALIRIRKPKKEEGVATLKVESDIWNYLPKIDRTIRIPTSMMMASWMGSHFTNDDLGRESQLIRDYDIELSYQGDREGVQVYELVLVPLPEAAVVWGKIEYRVRRADLMPLWAKYYGEDGKLRRTIRFSEFKTMGGRLVPALMTLTPEDEPEESTQIRYLELEFDPELPENTFSLSTLRKR